MTENDLKVLDTIKGNLWTAVRPQQHENLWHLY